jgi:uncharacterized protein YxjI
MGNNFTIRDINDNVIFIVKSSPETLFATREDRFLYDANGNPILHLRRMVRSTTIRKSPHFLSFHKQ